MLSPRVMVSLMMVACVAGLVLHAIEGQEIADDEVATKHKVHACYPCTRFIDVWAGRDDVWFREGLEKLCHTFPADKVAACLKYVDKNAYHVQMHNTSTRICQWFDLCRGKEDDFLRFD